MADHVPGGDTAEPRPRGLPAGPPYFAGRRRELAELRADIDRPGLDALRGRPADGCRVLLVAGRPGSGRTALAVRLVRALAGRYPDGVLFARLTGPDREPLPAERVAAELLRALPWPASGAGPDDDPAAALRAAFEGRRAVLLLDDAARSDQVLPLLPRGVGSLVVATSSGPLPGVPDVRPCTLGGLDAVAGVELLSHTIGEIRVTVDPIAAQGLTEACGGNPAALRLVGGWLAARPGKAVTDATRALREYEEAAVRGGGSLGEGTGTVWRAFRLVHDWLPRSTGRTLRLLSLAPGGLVDAHIASALSGTALGPARETLADFAGYGMLRPDPAGYRLPGWLRPLLRSVAEAHERPAETRLARARMLERTVRLLLSCRAAAEPDGPAALARQEEVPRPLRFADRQEAAEWLLGRLPELLAAARAAVDDGELDTLARRLILALVRALDAFDGAGPSPERYELHGMLLEVAERRAVPREQAAALIHLGELDSAAGRLKEAVTRFRGALDAARAGGDANTAGRALEALGDTYLALGDADRAADWYGRALVTRQTRGELAGVARLHGRMGDLHRAHDRFAPALREWRAAAAAHRRLRDLSGYAAALRETARVQRVSGRLEDALRTGHEALHWARQAGDSRCEVGVLLGMAEALEELGDVAGGRLQREAAASLPGAGADSGAGDGTAVAGRSGAVVKPLDA